MAYQSPFNANPDLAAMKQEIADRTFRIKMTGAVITGALMIAAAVAAIAFPGASMLLPIALAVGGGLAGMVTMKASTKLKIDEEYLQSYMQGKNYWGQGYREEVAEHGYAQPQMPMMAPPGGMTPGK